MSRIKYKGRDLESLSRAELIALIEYLFGRIEELKNESFEKQQVINKANSDAIEKDDTISKLRDELKGREEKK